MSKISAGQVEISIGNETITLVPTLDASLAISRRFEGLDPAIRKVLAQDIDTFVFVIAAGAGIKGAETKKLPSKVWKKLPDLIGPLTDYLLILRNGGRPLKDEPTEDDAGNAVS